MFAAMYQSRSRLGLKLNYSRQIASGRKEKVVNVVNVSQSFADNFRIGMDKIKGSLFQIMTQRMSDKDKASLTAHWGQKLDIVEKTEGGESTTGTATTTTSGTGRVMTSGINDTVSPKIEQSKHLPTVSFNGDIVEDKQLLHPLLGELVADLGYKKLYLTNVKSLALTPVWKKQRILRPERAAQIATDKIATKLGSSLPGAITLYMDRKSKEIGIIDGQHRAGALMLLAQKGISVPMPKYLLVIRFND
jgi:hypothetical protein